MRWLVVLAACVGCGRVDFDPRGPLFDFEFESDGLLHDRAGGHDGLCESACPTAGTDPARGRTLVLDGTQCLRVPDAPELRPARFSVAVWASRANSTGGVVFSRPQDGQDTHDNSMILSWDPGSVGLAVNGKGIAGTGIGVPTTVPLDGWHHFAATFDGSRYTLYIDAFMVAAMNTEPVIYVDDSYEIGCDIDYGGMVAAFSGAIDSVLLFDRVVAQDEITALAAP